jgi:hypothetical protein
MKWRVRNINLRSKKGYQSDVLFSQHAERHGFSLCGTMEHRAEWSVMSVALTIVSTQCLLIKAELYPVFNRLVDSKFNYSDLCGQRVSQRKSHAGWHGLDSTRLNKCFGKLKTSYCRRLLSSAATSCLDRWNKWWYRALMYSVWLRTGRPGFDPQQRPRIFLLASASKPALGPTQPPVQWVPGVLSLGVKRGRGVILTTHLHVVPRLRMSRSYTSSPPRRLHGV